MNTQQEGSLKGLFKSGGSFYVPPDSHPCVARDIYALGSRTQTGIPTTLIHDSFYEAFLAGDGRIDDCSLGLMLYTLDFEKPGTLAPVLESVGRPSGLSVLLGHVSLLMKQHKLDGSGKRLRGNFKRNIFIVPDRYDRLTTITTHWDGSGWTLACVYDIGKHRFNVGDRFFYAIRHTPSPLVA